MMIHDSHQLFFRSSFGAAFCEQKIWLRLRIEETEGPIVQVILRLWQDGRGEQRIVMRQNRQEASVYEIELTLPEEICVVWYYFIIKSAKQVLYYGNQLDNLGGEGQLYKKEPPSYQITVYERVAVTPAWFKQAVMYQIFPDRFYRAGKHVLQPKQGSLLHSHWDNIPYYTRDVETQGIFAYDFFGGNLKGIIKKLAYLKELGITVLYLNPIFLSPSNHRYDVSDYEQVDPMFGDNQLFAAFCAQARKMGIQVILDGVFSHTASDSIYFAEACENKNSPYYKWYRFGSHPDEYESWWGIDTMPNVEELEPSYLEFMVTGENSVVKQWLRRGAKGWRLDVADELPDAFIKEIRKAMKEVDPDTVLIGEVWEDASHKKSYGQLREYLGGEELDSVMNYPFRSMLLDFILGEADAEKTHRALMSLYENYPQENFYALMNLLGSHDRERILTILGQPGVVPEREKARHCLTEAQRRLAIDRLKLLVVWYMTFPGVPCIYYGDEAGVEGFADPYNRKTYPWGAEDQELLDWHRQLIALRKEYALFTTGEWISLPQDEDVYGYLRRISNGQDVFGDPQEDHTALILLNRNDKEEKTICCSLRAWCHGELRDLLTGEVYELQHGLLQLKLAPLAAKVLLQVEKEAFSRGAGVLLHLTSLPGEHGIGDLGGARKFLDFLAAGKQKLWQILPVNPVGFGESPYQTFSAFAGNHLLIDLDDLAVQIEAPPVFSETSIDFTTVRAWKDAILEQAFVQFQAETISRAYEVFLAEEKDWLEDYALFMALHEHFHGIAWHLWPVEIAFRQPEALAEYRERLADRVAYHQFLQYLFFTQWKQMKAYAVQKGIQIVGDIPIFVAHHSADVWRHPEFFDLKQDGSPRMVAGVPPDYFSPTGQLWGNPHYLWERMAADDYAWWRMRFQVLLKLVDIVRVDHFRGFAGFWQVDAAEETALNGRWVDGPGEHFFTVLQQYLGDVPIIVEDLGVITDDVVDLKQAFDFPGLHILQFVLPERGLSCEKNSVLYSGTHDNDTFVGWYQGLSAVQKEMVKQHAEWEEGENFPSDFLEKVFSSNANTVIVPLQDLLGLGSEARMNLPGTVVGNWGWRCQKEDLSPDLTRMLRHWVERCHR